ncbi:class I SAM-dependent methyltransferase [soil metagenome]
MPLFLSNRETELREKMDERDCELITLRNTYEQFGTINKLLGGWDKIYRDWIRPVLLKESGLASILDIGCGGGDIIRALSKMTKEDGLDVSFTGIDPDLRAIDFSREKNLDPFSEFFALTSGELVDMQQKYTVVISNHLLHHLDDEDLKNICNDAVQLSAQLVIFSDIERSDIGYGCFRAIAPIIFKNSFIAEDGMISIRRSYRSDELREKLPPGWVVHTQFPFRLLAIHKKNRDE